MKNLVLAVACCALLCSCVSVKVGARSEPSRLQFEGLGTAYAAISGIRPYDGTIIRLNVVSEENYDGELAAIEIWPVCELGIGLIGARLHVLPVEIGAGILFYDPAPEDYLEFDDEADDGDHAIKTGTQDAASNSAMSSPSRPITRS